MRLAMLVLALAAFITTSPAASRPRAKGTPPPATIPDGTSAYVEKIADGDTFTARVGGDKVTFRLLGIDCPESHKNAKCAKDGEKGRMTCDEQIPLGLKASGRGAELLKHKTVKIEGPTKLDRYGRTLAYVRMPDGRDYGLVMLREGLCEDFSWKYPHPRMREYLGK